MTMPLVATLVLILSLANGWAASKYMSGELHGGLALLAICTSLFLIIQLALI